MTTCANCRWKILESFTPEQEEVIKKGEGIPERRLTCTVNPPTPIPIVIMQQTPAGPRPMQIITSQHPTVLDSTPSCRRYERDLTRKPKSLEIVR